MEFQKFGKTLREIVIPNRLIASIVFPSYVIREKQNETSISQLPQHIYIYANMLRLQQFFGQQKR